MKSKISRDEVQKIIIHDSYFEKGHLPMKIFQTVVALLSWVSVLLPFIWLAIPYITSSSPKPKTYFVIDESEVETVMYMVIFLSIAFIVILITYVLLTFRNNYRFKHLLQKKVQYNEERLETRRRLMEEEYTKRFGPKEIREEVCFYSVKEEQNLETDFVRKLYKDGGVKL